MRSDRRLFVKVSFWFPPSFKGDRAALVARPPLMIGQTVSHYRILESLGQGGMGTVYLAEDTHLGRRVAVKFPSLSDSHDHRARFLREARAVSELSHPGIATLFDYGETAEGRPFLVMELAKGRPMSDLMQNGELSLSQVIAIITDVAKALTAAHARGVIHRDIKPSNIMIDDEGRIKVLDFGLAKQLVKEHVPTSMPEAATLLSTETRSGIVLGTPAYLSPEQAVGGQVDGRSDLFALGTLLYEATTGKTPFAGNSFIEIAANVLHVDPQPPSKLNPAIPKELDFIILKALAKKPNKRYQSTTELISDLDAVRDNLEAASGQTLIKRTSPSSIVNTKALSQISQMLQRPRVPISYLLVGAVLLIAGGGLALKLARPSPHTPPEEAQRWYQVGTSALREGAFYQASKALEKAVAADDAYLLAHARLAEALVELDYSDRAKDELLRVNSSDKAVLSEGDALYLDAITATVRRDYPKAVSAYTEIIRNAPDAEKPYVLVDLGRAQDNAGEPKKAIETYNDAAKRNADYPTPLLQLGILYGRQADVPNALASFEKAENIYQALGNLEGRAEVIFQRGALYNKLNKLSEAREQLEQALKLTAAADNKAQQIKTLLQLNSVAVDMGQADQASEFLRQAVELAQRNGMENLSARGLNDQGNNALIKGDYAKADRYFTDALQSAQRSKALSNEARARFSLASLRLRQNKADEALQYLEPALNFYQQGGYRSESFSCLALLARANRQKGDFESAYKANLELLGLAEQWNDQSQIALSHSELGSVLSRQEKYSEALDQLNQAYTFYSAQGIQRSIGYNQLGRADAIYRLGRPQEAEELLKQAATIADKQGSEIKQLSAGVKVVAAEVALSQDKFSDAKSKAAIALAATGEDFKSLDVSAKVVMALAQAYTGGSAAGKQIASEAVEIARQLNEPSQLAAAQLALAEVAMVGGDAKTAHANALEAQQIAARLGQPATEWRALLIAAQASAKLGDKVAVTEYSVRAKDLLAKLEQRWGSQNYQTYLVRPDIQRLRKELERLGTAA